MIIDGINYTGVSMEVYVAIQLVNGSKECVTDEALSKSITNIITKSNLTPEDIKQVFDLTFIPYDQRIEIMENIEVMKREQMSFDIYYHTLLTGRTYVKTVDDEDTASAMCIKNNKKMTPEEVKLDDGYMYYIEIRGDRKA